MNVKEKYNEICDVLKKIEKEQNGTLIEFPQVNQAILKVGDCYYTIVSYLDNSYHPYIEEIMIASPISLKDNIRISGKKPQHIKAHLGDQFKDVDVYYKDPDTTKLIEKLLEDPNFQYSLAKMGHHSFYIQDGQIFIHLNPSHDITVDFFKIRAEILLKTKEIIEKYM